MERSCVIWQAGNGEGGTDLLEGDADEGDRSPERVLELARDSLGRGLGKVIEPGRDEEEHGPIGETLLEDGLREAELPEGLLDGVLAQGRVVGVDEEAGAGGQATE